MSVLWAERSSKQRGYSGSAPRRRSTHTHLFNSCTEEQGFLGTGPAKALNSSQRHFMTCESWQSPEEGGHVTSAEDSAGTGLNLGSNTCCICELGQVSELVNCGFLIRHQDNLYLSENIMNFKQNQLAKSSSVVVGIYQMLNKYSFAFLWLFKICSAFFNHSFSSGFGVNFSIKILKIRISLSTSLKFYCAPRVYYCIIKLKKWHSFLIHYFLDLLLLIKGDIIFPYFVFSFFGSSTGHAGSLFSNEESKLQPLRWKYRVLTTGLTEVLIFPYFENGLQFNKPILGENMGN